eukprot:202083-Pelagomonas_calceolata.AAC.6
MSVQGGEQHASTSKRARTSKGAPGGVSMRQRKRRAVRRARKGMAAAAATAATAIAEDGSELQRGWGWQQ